MAERVEPKVETGRPRPTGFGRRPPGWLYVALAAVLLAGGLSFYRAQRLALSQRAQSELTMMVSLKAQQLADWRAERLGDAQALVTNQPFAAAVARWHARPGAELAAPVLAALTGVKEQYRYREALLADRAGRVLLGTTVAYRQLGPPTLAALAEAARVGHSTLADLHRDDEHGTPHLASVAWLPAGGGLAPHSLALVLVQTGDTFLFPLLDAWPVPHHSAEAMLVRRDGDSVLFLNNTTARPEMALRLRVPLTRTQLPAVQAVLGRVGLVTGRDYRDVPVLAVVHPLAETPWYLVAKIDLAEVFATRRLVSGLIVFALVAALSLAGAVGLLRWQVARKLYWKTLYQVENAQRVAAQRYSITLHSIADAVITTDAQGRVELLNAVAEELTGWRLEEALGRPVEEVFDIVNEYSRERVESPVQRVLREGVVVMLANHTLLLAKDGTERPIADSGAPIFDLDGQLAGVVLVFRDQAQERAHQTALETESANLRAVMTASPVALLVLDAELRVVDSNAAAERLCGYTREELHLSGAANALGRLGGLNHAVKEAVRLGQSVRDGEFDSVCSHDGQVERRWLVYSVEPVVLHGEPHAILALHDVTTARQAELARRDAAENLASAQRIARLGSYRFDIQRNWWTSSAMLDEIFGLDETFQRTADGWLELIAPEDRASMADYLANHVLAQRQPFDREYRIVRRSDGAVLWVHGLGQLQLDTSEQPAVLVGTIQDIEERHQQTAARESLLAQLAQAQKMESVGRLAGGVAHDFNNMLGVILGRAELALAALEPGHPVHEDLSEIADAAQRSADLTRQLLAFARKQTAEPRVLLLDAQVASSLRMLGRLLGEDVAIEFSADADLWPVKLDPAQVDQILANLCVNARDALPGGGRVTITVANVDAADATAAGCPPGEYVLLAVGDNGCGLDEETRAHLFEPFYTTKPRGQGTGLGLATVYGIVQQYDGVIRVASELGVGTTLSLFLPRCVVEDAAAPPAAPPPTQGCGQTILLVEDEAATLEMGRRMLERLGYTVLPAGSPGRALELAESQPEIDLLLTDVVMPEMHGRELAERVAALRPGLACLFTSGYTADVIAHRGVLDEGLQFVGKPFTLAELAAKVAQVLADAAKQAGS